MPSRSFSRVYLAQQAFLDDLILPVVEDWGQLYVPTEYCDFYPLLFDADGLLPWSVSGAPVILPAYDPSNGYGLLEWNIHLCEGLPGIFELATFSDGDDPDEPSLVETFEFTTRVISDLPRVIYNTETDTGTVPYQYWRFWPGKLATLCPSV